MAEIITEFPLDGGDFEIWGSILNSLLAKKLGDSTRRMYISAGTLYFSKGNIGLSNGSFMLEASNSADAAISVVGKTASCWAVFEIAYTLGSMVFSLSSIGGATNPAVLPTSWTTSFDANKGAHYITATKRAPALVWINAAGVPEGVVNELPGENAYSGYSTSDDANDLIYPFLKLDFTHSGFSMGAVWKTANYVIPNLSGDHIANMPGGRTVTLPSAALNTGVRVKIIKSDDNPWWVKIISASGTMSSKSGVGATISYIRRYMDSVTWISDGANWYAIDDSRLLFTDSGAIRCSAWQGKKRGTCNLVHAGAALTESQIKGMKLIGNTSASYGWITAYDSGSKTIFLRDVVCTDTAKVFQNGETLNIVDVDAAAVTSTTLSAADWKNTETYAYHGLNCGSDLLCVEFLYSADGTTWKKQITLENGHTLAGIGAIYNSANQLQIQTLTNGIEFSNIGTTADYIQVTDAYYKIRIWKQ